MSGGFFTGLALTFPLIVLGAQVFYIVSLKIDGEIGLPRMLFLLGAVFPAVAALAREETTARLGFLLFLPLLFLGASRLAEHMFWDRCSTRALRREIAEWEAVLSAEPGHETACVVLGDLHLKLGEHDEARRYYLAAIERGADRTRLESKISHLDRPAPGAPRLTGGDLRTALRELKWLPLLFAVFLSALIALVFFFYLMRFLPAWLTFVILVLMPLVLFARWLVGR